MLYPLIFSLGTRESLRRTRLDGFKVTSLYLGSQPVYTNDIWKRPQMFLKVDLS